MGSNSLIHRYLLGDLTDDEVEQLNQLLAHDPELRREFVQAATIDAGLREVVFERGAEPLQANVIDRPSKRRSWVVVAGVLAVVVVIAAVGRSFFTEDTVAVLASSENAAWESSLPTTPGSELTTGLLNLKSGVATIRFDSGAEVLLEAPAALELISPMRGRLVLGAAVVDVPDSAIGFIVETPDGYAVDYGTRFAVRVDQTEKQSNFEIIEGEIAVHHSGTGKEIRLTEPHKAVSVHEGSVNVIDLEQQTNALETASDVTRIGTNGRATSVLRNNKRHKFLDPAVLSVKKTENGKWDHRSFFAFDLSTIDASRIRAARLRLNLVPSQRGFASRLPVINRFGVYGLTNPDKTDWVIDSTWEEAPAPEDGILLGAFEIPRSQERGTFGIANKTLVEFLQEFPGQSVTLILVRESTQVEGSVPGLTHMFASDAHPVAVGPMLELSIDEP